MSVPVKGQADYLNLGDWNAICSVCGRKYKASEMVRQPDGVGTPWGGGTYVCKRDYRPRQPQDFVRGIPDKMAPPWVQPRPSIGSFARLPTYNVDEDTDELIIYVNVGSPNAAGVRMVITIASGVTLSALTLTETTSTDDDTVNYAGGVIINNGGVLGPVTNPDDIPLTIRNFSGGARGIALKFTQQPTDTTANSTITPAVTVALVDLLDSDAVITDFDGDVEIELTGGPGTGILSGTLTVAAVAGVATFSDLSVDIAGTGYSLVATATDPLIDVSRTSNSFEITDGYTLTISADRGPYDVRFEFIAAFGSPIPNNVKLRVIVEAGVVVHSDDGGQALYWGGVWVGTPVFSLVNNGYILGWADHAGNGGNETGGTNGNAGGAAITMAGHNIIITNASGFIWGGGGGGGGGGGALDVIQSATAGGGGGGRGGGDYQFTAGGLAFANQVAGTWTESRASADGATSSSPVQSQTGAVGGVGGILINPGTLTGGTGGAGGDYGAAGSNGGNATGGTSNGTGGTGGAAGKAINLSGGVATFINGSGSPNVKGAVS